MFCVIRIWVCSEASSENNGRSVSVNVSVPFFFSICTCVRILCSDISNKWVEAGVDVFDIVLAHDLPVDDGRVLLLLREEVLK